MNIFDDIEIEHDRTSFDAECSDTPGSFSCEQPKHTCFVPNSQNAIVPVDCSCSTKNSTYCRIYHKFLQYIQNHDRTGQFKHGKMTKPVCLDHK